MTQINFKKATSVHDGTLEWDMAKQAAGVNNTTYSSLQTITGISNQCGAITPQIFTDRKTFLPNKDIQLAIDDYLGRLVLRRQMCFSINKE